MVQFANEKLTCFKFHKYFSFICFFVVITLFLESLPVRSFMFYLHQLTKYLQCFVSPYNECDLYIFFFCTTRLQE
jgi:hypothetical protein